ncbi:hypothetical protein FQA39_LY16458 [Lamprigera yunnana]|nr:hypothetical protein FQA39_LY16458 [Lamprigera yunnana]
MNTLRCTACNRVFKTESINEDCDVCSATSSNHSDRGSKEEKEKCGCVAKESITLVNDENKRKPICFTIKTKKLVLPNLQTSFSQSILSSNWDKTKNCKKGLQISKSSVSLPFRENSVFGGGISSNVFSFSKHIYRSLSGTQIKRTMYRSNPLDYSNFTKAAQVDKQKAWGLRSWRRTSLGKSFNKFSVDSPGCIFKLMSYNVLAQELLEQHSYLYKYHNPNALEWEQRWFTLLNELKYHNADIICLQEVQSSHLDNYYKELHGLGYKSIFKQRTGERTDGCAIYYKESMFNLIEYTTVEYNQYNISILNRDNIAIIAKFSPKNNIHNEFIVATTHLLYNPRREDVRLAQTQVLLSEVDRIAYKRDQTRQVI